MFIVNINIFLLNLLTTMTSIFSWNILVFYAPMIPSIKDYALPLGVRKKRAKS